MIAQLDQTQLGASAAPSVDTLAVLSTWDGIDVRLVPEAITTATGPGTDCSVAGLYIEDQTPPILAVARAISTDPWMRWLSVPAMAIE